MYCSALRLIFVLTVIMSTSSDFCSSGTLWMPSTKDGSQIIMHHIIFVYMQFPSVKTCVAFWLIVTLTLTQFNKNGIFSYLIYLHWSFCPCLQAVESLIQMILMPVVHLSKCNFVTTVATQEIISVPATALWVVPDARVKAWPCVFLQARAGLALWSLWRTHSAVQGDSCGEASACPKTSRSSLRPLYTLPLCCS